MGYFRNECLVVTGSIDAIHKAHKECQNIFSNLPTDHRIFINPKSLISDVVPGVVNDCATFMVAVDGSKEGWFESDLIEEKRILFMEWLKEQDDFYDWALVLLGGDDHECKILRSNYLGD